MNLTLINRLRSLTSLFACLLLILFSAVSPADTRVAQLRVLVEYDADGHRLMRVVERKNKPAVPQSDHIKKAAQMQALQRSAITHPEGHAHSHTADVVTLHWYSEDGALIDTQSMGDPRLTHAPLEESGQAPTVVGLDTGAYMVTGPVESAVLEITLPQNDVLGLDAQTWRLELTR